MKWGRKKPSPPSSRGPLIARVFPGSWFSKFKQKGGGPEISSGKKQQRGKLDFPTRSSSFSAGWREAILYSVHDDDDDDDTYWRLSFCEERAEARRRACKINPLWYDSDDAFQVPVSSCRSFGLREMELPRRVLHRSTNDMVLDIEKLKEKQCRENILRENGASRKKKRNRGAQLRKEYMNSRCSRKLSRGVGRKKKGELETGPDEGEGKSLNPVETDKFPIGPENLDRTKGEVKDSDEEDFVFAALDGEESDAASESASLSEGPNLEKKKSKEIKIKSESQMKSANKSRRPHSRKKRHTGTTACAPKTDCRIRVLEDMKKARLKLKKERKEQEEEDSTVFNSFAEVKSSFNPEQDFRDSMVEMMRYQGIRRPEELEELLACYLTLNCDGYHDLIIKVFQQVWFELSRGVC